MVRKTAQGNRRPDLEKKAPQNPKAQAAKKQNATKKASHPEKQPTEPPATATAPTSLQSVKYQQRLVKLFSETFSTVLSKEEFTSVLQEIKQALFNRNFAAAFGREDYLEAYAARWSPTRAICYAEVLLSIRGHLDSLFGSGAENQTPGSTKGGQIVAVEDGIAQVVQQMADIRTQDVGEIPEKPRRKVKMLSIGGCAAEHVAFASYLHCTYSDGHLTLLDSAPWSHVSSLLQERIISPPELSKYASAAIKAANKPLLEPHQLLYNFSQNDVLALEKEKLVEIVGAEPQVVTLLFTLNELYTGGGISKTTKLLRTLGEVLSHGSLLLVVDSPGSYSEASIGKEQKRYPMQWLLNHTLLETKTEAYKWERLESEDSIWFRLSDDISYPIPLENMRYQKHLYKIFKRL